MAEQYISRKVQLINAAVLVVLALLSIYGMTSRVIISHEYARYGQLSAIALAAMLSLLYYYEYFKKDSKLRHLTRLGAYCIIPVVPLGLLLVLFPSLVWGVPAIAHHLTARDAEARYAVHAPDVGYRNTTARCRGRLQIEDSFVVGGKICSVPEGIYGAVREGSIVTLRGKKSYFGFSYFRSSASGETDVRLETGT